MLVIPWPNNIAPQAAIIKNITRLDKNMPDQTSTRILVTSCLAAPFREAIEVLPSATWASISCEVCQKNKYGEIVVHKMAQIRSTWSFSRVILGQNAWLNTLFQSKLARIA